MSVISRSDVSKQLVSGKRKKQTKPSDTEIRRRFKKDCKNSGIKPRQNRGLLRP